MTKQAENLLIEVDISSYWHAGTGRAGGDDVDALIDKVPFDNNHFDKDRFGLPVLRGRHLKGLLRETGENLVAWKADGWTKERVNILFGRKAIAAQNPSEGEAGREAQRSTPGCIRFGDASLPKPIVEAMHEEPELASQLVRRLASTRIDFESGVATDKSLRSMEVAIPLKLFAKLRWDTADRQTVQTLQGEESHEQIDAEAACWRTAIQECLPYVFAIGANRNRGFGRAKLSIVEV